MKVTFLLPGEVRGQGRPRFSTRCGFVKVYESKEDTAYKHRIRSAFLAAAGGWEMRTEKPVRVCMRIYKKPAQSWAKKKIAAALAGGLIPYKPDIDNVAKIVMDALNGIAWLDDSQVMECIFLKRHGAEDMLAVTISIIEEGEESDAGSK